MIVPELPLRTDTNKRMQTEGTRSLHGTSDTLATEKSSLELELEDAVQHGFGLRKDIGPRFHGTHAPNTTKDAEYRVLKKKHPQNVQFRANQHASVCAGNLGNTLLWISLGISKSLASRDFTVASRLSGWSCGRVAWLPSPPSFSAAWLSRWPGCPVPVVLEILQYDRALKFEIRFIFCDLVPRLQKKACRGNDHWQ